MDNPISIKLFTDVTDSLRNYDNGTELAEGLLWRKLTEAERFFMLELKTTKVPYSMTLFADENLYQIAPWVLEFGGYQLFDANGNEVNPSNHHHGFYVPGCHSGLTVELPRTGTGSSRFARIEGAKIPGNYLLWEAWVKPTHKIDLQNGPEIEQDYYDLLTDYVLSFYRVKVIDNKQIVNPNFKDTATVIKEVMRTKERLYSLNAVEVFRPSGWS
jgi:hypothetical protein